MESGHATAFGENFGQIATMLNARSMKLNSANVKVQPFSEELRNAIPMPMEQI
jgi:hypothetical protein